MARNRNRNRGRSWNRSSRGNRNGNRRPGPRPRRGLLSRLLRNRYDEQSSWVSIGDVISNAKEIFYGWTERVPRGSRILWRNGKIVGHTTSFRAGPR